MTDTDTPPSDSAPEAPAFPPTLDEFAPKLPPGMHPVLPAYRWVLRLQAAFTWVPLFIGALVIDNVALVDQPARGILSAVIGLLAISIVTIVPRRIYRRLGYRLNEKTLRVVRGWLFHTDTVVPLVRVQHLDVARGPLDKIFGTASLIVHTAGTHNSVVTLPGLDPVRAEEMRAEIRAEIRTDWQ